MAEKKRKAFAGIPANWKGLTEEEKGEVSRAIADELRRQLRPRDGALPKKGPEPAK